VFEELSGAHELPNNGAKTKFKSGAISVSMPRPIFDIRTIFDNPRVRAESVLDNLKDPESSSDRGLCRILAATFRYQR
jgi:hypothetical protein